MKRVLIADNDAELREFLKEAILRDGFPVEACADAFALGGLLGSFRPAIIVLDSDLPPSGGFPVVERLRERGHLIPIILMASEHDEELKSICEQWPLVQYLPKPFGLQELLQALART